MAREAKVIIAAEDKTKAGVASAKAGMGSLIEAAKESKRAVEGINAVLQFGGWTILAAKAVRALGDITKEARDQSEEFKRLNSSFDALRKSVGESLVSVMSPMVDWVGRIAKGWADTLTEYNKYRKALTNNDDEYAAALKAQMDIKAKLQAASVQRKQDADQGLVTTNIDKQIATLIADRVRADARVAALEVIRGIGEGAAAAGGGWNTSLRTTPREQWDSLKFANGLKPGQSWDGSGGETRYESMQAWRDKQRYRQSSPDLGYQGAYIGDDYESTGPGNVGLGHNSLNPLNALAPVIQAFGTMGASLSSVNQILNYGQTILKGVFDVIGPLIDAALKPLTDLLLIIGNTLGEMLAPVIKFLGEIIAAVAKAILAVVNWIRKILGMSQISTPASSYQSTSSAGGSGASYAGAQSITFNFYNQGNMVGSGGFEELARIIEGLIAQRARYA